MNSQKTPMLEIKPTGGGKEGLIIGVPSQLSASSIEDIAEAFAKAQQVIIYLLIKSKKLNQKQIKKVFGEQEYKKLSKLVAENPDFSKYSIAIQFLQNKPLISAILFIKNSFDHSFLSFMEEKIIKDKKPDLMYS